MRFDFPKSGLWMSLVAQVSEEGGRKEEAHHHIIGSEEVDGSGTPVSHQ